jgi:hypothetical protein
VQDEIRLLELLQRRLEGVETLTVPRGTRLQFSFGHERIPWPCPALGNGGHDFGCNLEQGAKEALIAFLESHP